MPEIKCGPQLETIWMIYIGNNILLDLEANYIFTVGLK